MPKSRVRKHQKQRIQKPSTVVTKEQIVQIQNANTKSSVRKKMTKVEQKGIFKPSELYEEFNEMRQFGIEDNPKFNLETFKCLHNYVMQLMELTKTQSNNYQITEFINLRADEIYEKYGSKN